MYVRQPTVTLSPDARLLIVILPFFPCVIVVMGLGLSLRFSAASVMIRLPRAIRAAPAALSFRFLSASSSAALGLRWGAGVLRSGTFVRAGTSDVRSGWRAGIRAELSVLRAGCVRVGVRFGWSSFLTGPGAGSVSGRSSKSS